MAQFPAEIVGRYRRGVSPLAGPLFAAALLVAFAGIGKLAQPATARVALRTAGFPSSVLFVRLLAVGELLVAAAALVVGGRVAGALVAASPYLQDDARVAVWEHEVEKRIEAIRKKTWNQHFSGTMRRQLRPIGG